jgi:hypothetical protein
MVSIAVVNNGRSKSFRYTSDFSSSIRAKLVFSYPIQVFSAASHYINTRLNQAAVHRLKNT